MNSKSFIQYSKKKYILTYYKIMLKNIIFYIKNKSIIIFKILLIKYKKLIDKEKFKENIIKKFSH